MSNASESLLKNKCLRLFSLIIFVFINSCISDTEIKVASPDGKISATLMYEKESGTLKYIVQSGGKKIIMASPVGINTNLADFRSGLKFKKTMAVVIDETYKLPQGKVSTYRNHANEQVLTFTKEGRELEVHFRVYNDGVAYNYEIPGAGEIEIHGESSGINLNGDNFTFYGQKHPNRYGYESALGPIEGDLASNPVLAELKDLDHFVLMGQAATYGNYVQTHFKISGSLFTFEFPLDQEKVGAVLTNLPFQSPWRIAIISEGNPGKIVESYMVENLNPPTNSAFLKDDGTCKDWILPGNVMWDYIAKDSDKPRRWIDAAAEMGWRYYMADAGNANKWGGPDSILQIIQYAKEKNISVLGWAHTREFNTREKAEETIGRYSDWGLKGAKIDFFDQNTLSENPRGWRDYEDTQQSLKMRDWIFELGLEKNFLLELHGNTVPTGERRQYPNLMTLEGVDGMERRAKPAANDLTIPYVRNVMGPVSYTVIHFERSPGTHAYQLAMPIVYEAGLKIYAEHGRKMLEWPGREMIQDIPAAWDETRFIEGLPASHIIIARRNGDKWYLGGMTDKARDVNISLNFLENGRIYYALIFSDDTHSSMKRELIKVSSDSTLSIGLLERGGFAIRFTPEG